MSTQLSLEDALAIIKGTGFTTVIEQYACLASSTYQISPSSVVLTQKGNGQPSGISIDVSNSLNIYFPLRYIRMIYLDNLGLNFVISSKEDWKMETARKVRLC
ncbi:hypothetical protein D3C71_1094350 [compost metagenome]